MESSRGELFKRVSSAEILSRERPIHLKSVHQNSIYKWPIHVICQIFLLTTKFSWNAWKTNLLQVKLVKLNCRTSSSPKYQFITTLCYEVYINSINGKMGKGCVDRQFTEGKVLLATKHIKRCPVSLMALPTWLNGKESSCQCKRCRFNPWVGKIPWKRKWQHSSQSHVCTRAFTETQARSANVLQPESVSGPSFPPLSRSRLLLFLLSPPES